jgi:anti-anti-sigma regulatory factor
MAMNAEWLKIDESRVVQALRDARENQDNADRELVLDFSSVYRIDPSALRAMERLADMADDKVVKVMLHGVNINIYKVLRLVNLTRRFSFVT